MKKINKYLLLHHPTLWNVKIFPFLIISFAFNIFFLLLGFSVTKIQDNIYYSPEDLRFLYFLASLSSVLCLIFWLIYYLKNNAFKNFYPKSNFSLRKEFVCVLIICSSFVAYSFSVSLGNKLKFRFLTSEKAVKTEMKIISDARFFMRENPYQFKNDQTQSLYSFNFFYYSDADSIKLKNWLKTEQKDSIKHLFTQYLVLQKKYKLTSNLTPDLWLRLTYFPPKYQIPNTNFISQSKSYNQDSEYYVQYDALNFILEKIEKAHNNEFFIEWINILLSISGGLSLLIFSFRITGKKSWLISLISLGIFFFFSFFSTIVFSPSILFSVVYFIVFIIISMRVYFTIHTKKEKGLSSIFLNIVLWTIPVILPLIYSIFSDFINSYSKIDDFVKDNFQILFLTNLLVSFFFVLLSIPLLRKWKALPGA